MKDKRLKEYIDKEIFQRFKSIGFEINPERGERSKFFKVTITLPGDMLQAIKTFGIEKRLQGQKDFDVSSIIREAVAYYLLKWSEEYKESVLKRILHNN